MRTAVCAVALLCVLLAACANSILRNAAEAGFETLYDGHQPTPTAAAQKKD
jgi:hypothetical protein